MVEPHLKWLGFAFTIFFAIWKWWDGRERIIYRRVERLLEQRNDKLKKAYRDTIDLILRPEPGLQPAKPLWIERSLQKVIKKQWQPIFNFLDPLKHAEFLLQVAHQELAAKNNTLRKQKTIVGEQRFSAFLIQGAIAAAQAGRQSEHERRRRLDNNALQKFNDALRVHGKQGDVLALELKGLQLQKLGRAEDAADTFADIEAHLAAGLANIDEATRAKLAALRLRNARYRACLEISKDAPGTANGIFLAFYNNERDLFTSHLQGNELCERAHFHEAHATARAIMTRNEQGELPRNGVALQSLQYAVDDYNALKMQLSPFNRHFFSRFYRWMGKYILDVPHMMVYVVIQ